MECKNCNLTLEDNHNFCTDCGAKVIRNRITTNNLWYDFTEQFFNLDNTFLLTFKHLFTKPETVIGGYIDGVRKKYMNPISYLTVALTLTGLMVFFLKRTFPEGIDFDIFKTGIYSPETSKKMTDFLFAFYSILYILYIPILAACGWLSFKNKNYYYSEFIVSFIYSQAQLSFISVFTTLLTISIAPSLYTLLSMLSLLIMISYSLYVMKRISDQKKGEFLPSALIFLVMFGFGFFILSILQFILMYMYGVISFEAFIPK
ncbi:DUF3667 domain-containing protein [Cellulophaga sp. HaHaR_3_176]|uniref:DUF3667 domain-containing protein n=1 Tax=Cellulophaga sp. HaHaR_3_176 TaxID=1942464 RepID=UPI001C1F54C5|nr:DUF3667 domain-containing protein [Cellulophaga sp. HaHaR_3_176]QWX82847.1 DUF3667 domain-containing protein [Cellulophaga sp. HaHaR_3_176]